MGQAEQSDLFGDPPQKRLGIGYAGRPGMGPEGETCGSCVHSKRHGSGNKHFYKCHHELGYRSSCEASDIRLRTPACQFWKKDQ